MSVYLAFVDFLRRVFESKKKRIEMLRRSVQHLPVKSDLKAFREFLDDGAEHFCLGGEHLKSMLIEIQLTIC